MKFYLYILYSPTFNKYYVGSSDDPWRRLQEHNTSYRTTNASKFRPWDLSAVSEAGDSRADAMRIEKFIKRQKNTRIIKMLTDPTFKPAGKLALWLESRSCGPAKCGKRVLGSSPRGGAQKVKGL